MPGLRNGAVPDPQAIAKRITSRQIAIVMAQAALGAKAEDVVILDLRRLSHSFDFFVLFSASSGPRFQAIIDYVEEELSARGVRRRHVEGQREGGWVLVDYGPVVGHIFSPSVRDFYALERLWADAPCLRIPKG